MTSRPPIRHCPVCGIAMQAQKSKDELSQVDTFVCLNCETVIRESRRPPDGGKSR